MHGTTVDVVRFATTEYHHNGVHCTCARLMSPAHIVRGGGRISHPIDKYSLIAPNETEIWRRGHQACNLLLRQNFT